MVRRPFELWLLCCSLASSTACMTEFSGYHLESSAGVGGTTSSGGANSEGGSPADGGAASHAGTVDPGGAPLGEGGVSGASMVDHDPESAGAAGSGVSEPLRQPSCDSLPGTCGPQQNDDCCAVAVVPGGTYERSNKLGATATVGSFALDTYEISVGRLRRFVAAYSQNMTPSGAGKNPNNPKLDVGWNEAWNAKLPPNAAAFQSALSCPNGTFSASVGVKESAPATCLNWYEAAAFCIWDGGRLPTEAEWNYAAAAGSEQRVHPWGADAPDDTLAVFCPGSCGKIQAVGSKPNGNGKWGHADLMGNAWEWNVDVFSNPYLPGACLDCANTTGASSAQRVFRGGSAGNDASYLLSSTRASRDPNDHNGFVGARCARSP